MSAARATAAVATDDAHNDEEDCVQELDVRVEHRRRLARERQRRKRARAAAATAAAVAAVAAGQHGAPLAPGPAQTVPAGGQRHQQVLLRPAPRHADGPPAPGPGPAPQPPQPPQPPPLPHLPASHLVYHPQAPQPPQPPPPQWMMGMGIELMQVSGLTPLHGMDVVLPPGVGLAVGDDVLGPHVPPPLPPSGMEAATPAAAAAAAATPAPGILER
jgi:hypothetical protein